MKQDCVLHFYGQCHLNFYGGQTESANHINTAIFTILNVYLQVYKVFASSKYFTVEGLITYLVRYITRCFTSCESCGECD